MLDKIKLKDVLFLDIETVTQFSGYEKLDEGTRELWNKKSKYFLRNETELTEQLFAESYLEKAAIFAEFGRIVCISVGILTETEKGEQLRLKSFFGDDEKKILFDFCELLKAYYGDDSRHFLCGHNLKEFDVPYICRRLLINQMPLPQILEIRSKKPWELNYLLDTMQLWKFGEFKNFTSLDLLARCFGIPSPKTEMDGSLVGRVYWAKGDLDAIKHYCERDVVTVVQLLKKYRLEKILEEDQIISV